MHENTGGLLFYPFLPVYDRVRIAFLSGLQPISVREVRGKTILIPWYTGKNGWNSNSLAYNVNVCKGWEFWLGKSFGNADHHLKFSYENYDRIACRKWSWLNWNPIGIRSIRFHIDFTIKNRRDLISIWLQFSQDHFLCDPIVIFIG